MIGSVKNFPAVPGLFALNIVPILSWDGIRGALLPHRRQTGMDALMSRNAGSGENGRFDEISSVNLTIFMQFYMSRDGFNVLANLAILAIFMQITSPEMGLTCWRIWRFLCKLHGQRWV